jgi:hypothetical protein
MAAAVAAASDGAFAVFYRTAVDADPIRVSVRDAAAVELESAAPYRRMCAGDASNSASSARLQFGGPLLVKIGFGGGLCPPAQGDGNLIHHRRDRERTNRPHPHHELCSVSAARQKPFIALQ